MPSVKSNRPSPPFHAKDFMNKIKVGNDKLKYISVPDKNGVYKWKKYEMKNTKKLTKKDKMKTYYTHDNGSKNIMIQDYIDNSKVIIYKIYQDNTSKKLLEVKYNEIFFGKPPSKIMSDSRYSYEKGSSVLLHINKNKYMFIGETVFMFLTLENEKINSFVSPIGNSDVVYPYAVGENYTYLLLDTYQVAIPNIYIKSNPYDDYWAAESLSRKIKVLPKSTSLKMKNQIKEQLIDAVKLEKSAKKYTIKMLFSNTFLNKND
jgi:hypothetical protein